MEMDSGEEVFLNNVLLENRHAVRKETYALSDWEEPDAFASVPAR